MGRGRTTTGMVIATLVYLNRIGASGTLVFPLLKHSTPFLLSLNIFHDYYQYHSIVILFLSLLQYIPSLLSVSIYLFIIFLSILILWEGNCVLGPWLLLQPICCILGTETWLVCQGAGGFHVSRCSAIIYIHIYIYFK